VRQFSIGLWFDFCRCGCWFYVKRIVKTLHYITSCVVSLLLFCCWSQSIRVIVFLHVHFIILFTGL